MEEGERKEKNNLLIVYGNVVQMYVIEKLVLIVVEIRY